MLDLILPNLYELFNTCLQQEYCSIHFRQSVTVVLRKPNKNENTQHKSYQPIALLNTLKKIAKTIVIY